MTEESIATSEALADSVPVAELPVAGADTFHVQVVTSTAGLFTYDLDRTRLCDLMAGKIPSIEIATPTSPGIRFVILIGEGCDTDGEETKNVQEEIDG